MFNKPTNEITFKDINELLYLKQEREGQRLDYKKEFHKDGKEFAKDTTAFANADGGFIIYGIDEKTNQAVGIGDNVGNGKIEDWIANILNDYADQPIKYEVKFINLNDESEPSFVVVLQILESDKKPIYVKNNSNFVCYIRKGTSVFSAKPADIQAMYQQTSEKNQTQIKVAQKLKGNNNIQIAVNQGTVIKTEKVVKKNEVVTNPDIHISQEQAKQILDIVTKIVEINQQAGKFKTPADKGKCFAQTWTSFKNRFNVTSYHLLPKDNFEEAIKWLNKEIAYKYRPKLRQGNNHQWKNDNYGAIYAKARQLEMEKEELYQFAFDKLKLRQPISSLKELSDTRLNKLYKLIFSH